MTHPTARSIQLRRACLALATLAALLGGAGGALSAASAASGKAGSDSNKAPAADFEGDRAETERFLAWERSIQLTPEQEAVRVAALSALPAPCCKQFTAATCCCPCNMARATWGLAKHLIAEEGADAERVRTTVAAWHHAINPDGFSGDVCSTGGCNRPFAHNGCGGMGELKF
jgi:hypothetical protein